MKIILRDYQQVIIDKINASTEKRNCVQAPTGAGKTIMFSYLANNFKGRVLILVNRRELLEQTDNTIEGVPFLLTAGCKEIDKTAKVTIAMVETFNNRRKKNIVSANEYDLIIVDEIQNLQFTKAFEGYDNRLLGFTATPVIDKKEFFHRCKRCDTSYDKKTKCCKTDTQEFSRNVTLKNWYGELITGFTVQQLIDVEKLTMVHNYCCETPELDKLKTDKSGMFTTDSEEEVFNNDASLENLTANYKEHCTGLKTMVFNSNIKNNTDAYERFLELGYNVRSFDSKSDDDRAEIVEWFRNTPDAVLMSVGVFTTGFDVDDVQTIIMNKATQSLSLYQQIVGRGGRITKKIFKPYFKLIDLGGNVARHGSWSDDIDWNTIYNNTLEKKRTVRDLEDFKICYSCEAMVKSYPCEFCGVDAPEQKEKGEGKVNIATEMDRLPAPRGNHILNYALSCNMDVNDAKKLTANYILDMLIFSKTSKEAVYKDVKDLRSRIEKMIRPIYHALHGSELKGNRIRTVQDFVNKVITSIDKYYE
jgi:superfamily II DNA or RNA helicase